MGLFSLVVKKGTFLKITFKLYTVTLGFSKWVGWLSTYKVNVLKIKTESELILLIVDALVQ